MDMIYLSNSIWIHIPRVDVYNIENEGNSDKISAFAQTFTF